MTASTPQYGSQVIDGEEVLPEEIPAELLERVSQHHQYLLEVTLQVRRSGKWSTMRVGKISWATQPPDTPVHDICTRLVQTAREDSETNGEGQRYRARLRCGANNHEYSRYATVRGVLNAEGAYTVVDDGESSGESDPMRTLIEAKQQSDSVSFQAMQLVLKSVHGYASIADSFNKLLTSAGQVYTQHVSGQAEMLRIKMEMEAAHHQHLEKMAKMERGFGLLEKPVTRIGDEIVDYVSESIREKKNAKAAGSSRRGRPRPGGRGAKPNGASTTEDARSSYAVTLDGVFGSLTDDQIQQAQAIMSEDEWKLVTTARHAKTDEMFDGVFARFHERLAERGDEGTNKWVQEMSAVVGMQSMAQIGLLLKRIEEAKRAARQAAES